MQEVENYLRELNRHLDCPRHIRKPFLDKTRQMALELTQGRPAATRQEITDSLGESRELAQDFLETLDRDMLERYQRQRRIYLYGCIAVLAVAFAAMTAWAIHLWITPMNIEITETLVIYPEVSIP